MNNSMDLIDFERRGEYDGKTDGQMDDTTISVEPILLKMCSNYDCPKLSKF
jgi:hypothetical protein